MKQDHHTAPRPDLGEGVNVIARCGSEDCVRAAMPSSFGVAISVPGIERVLADSLRKAARRGVFRRTAKFCAVYVLMPSRAIDPRAATSA